MSEYIVVHQEKGFTFPHVVLADSWEDVMQLLEDSYGLAKDQDLIVTITITKVEKSNEIHDSTDL